MRSRLLTAVTVLLAVLTAWALALVCRYELSIGETRRHHIESILLILSAVWLLRLTLLSASQEPQESNRVRFPWLVLVFVLAGGFALYWQTLGVGFLSDDFVLASWARQGEFVSGTHVFVRPVPLLLWHLLFDAGGGPGAIHVLNVILHGLNVALLVHLCRQLGLGWLAAITAGVLFLVWPTQVEPVTWASSISDVLMTTLALVTVVTFLRLAPGLTVVGAGALVFMMLAGVFTKETAVMIPAMLIVIAATRWRRDRYGAPELWLLVVMTTMSAAYLGWRLLIRPEVAGTIQPRITRYVLKEQLARTFANLASPVAKDSASPVWMPLAFGILVVLLIVWPVLWADRRRHGHELIVVGGLWCLLATAPAIGYLLVGDHLEGSRYLYLAAAGWAMLLAASWETSMQRDAGMRVAGGAALAILIGLSVQQSRTLLTSWREASLLRGVLLQKADAATRREGCGVVEFKNLPEMHLGAQLFRNGFEEAFASVRSHAPDGRRCQLEWTGDEFTPIAQK
jgi:hypothetical protein